VWVHGHGQMSSGRVTGYVAIGTARRPSIGLELQKCLLSIYNGSKYLGVGAARQFVLCILIHKLLCEVEWYTLDAAAKALDT
jgi:hypothetical protein